MKIRDFLKLAMFFALGAVFFTSCEDDPIVDPLGPSVTFGLNSGADLDVMRGETFTITVNATSGDVDLNTVSIYEDGTLISFDRLTINGDPAAANPILLFGADKSDLTYDIGIVAHEDAATKVYSVEVADESGLSGSVAINVTVSFELLDATCVGVLFNRSGPVGTGGLDLDECLGTGSTSDLAEIRDEGNVATTSQEWKKQIAGVNGAVVKYVVPGQNGVAEDFTFESVEFKDQIATLFANGVDFTATNSDGELVSNVVEVGNYFVVSKDGINYLLEVTEITETNNDNADSYTMNVKK